MKKNKRDLKMSAIITENERNSAYKTVLDIDEDTSFNISYDTFIYDEKKYLYIKMEENTALAPFYYNRSYEINELHKINNIFRAVDIEGANGDSYSYEVSEETLPWSWRLTVYYK